MGDATHTKNLLLQTSAELFNLNGYKATSLGDITANTRLTKGAIYRHFGSKENLECEALRYMTDAMMSSVRDLVKAEKNCRQKLIVIVDYFSSYTVNPPFEGGCPLMNAGTEADDAHPRLKKQVAKTMRLLHQSVVTILDRGQEHGQLVDGLNSSSFASVFVSALEGAIVLMQVTDNKKHLRDVADHLKREVLRITDIT